MDIYYGSGASASAATSTAPATVVTLALRGRDARTASPSSVMSSTFGSGARPAASEVASLDRSVNESTVD